MHIYIYIYILIYIHMGPLLGPLKDAFDKQFQEAGRATRAVASHRSRMPRKPSDYNSE